MTAVRRVEMNPWKEVIIEALIVDFILSAEHETDPKKALADLIAWETTVALDPRVSTEAYNMARWVSGDWCDVCEAPQMVLPDGSHDCMSLPRLRSAYEAEKVKNTELSKLLRRAAARLSVLSDSEASRLAREIQTLGE
jgi:hypothetical protein